MSTADPSPPDAPTLGIWGTIASSSEGGWAPPSANAPHPSTPRVPELASALVRELDSGLATLSRLPAAVTFFGGARIRSDDPYYADAKRMGATLAALGIPPRTGAGPGIMSAVPEGFRQALGAAPSDVDRGAKGAQSRAKEGRSQTLTQGFNIRLPFEQAINPSIDVSLELAYFPTRKLLLFENAIGIVAFPGGFGTLDELFEVWALKLRGKLGDPILLYGEAFWSPILEVLERLWRAADRSLCDAKTFEAVEVVRSPEEVIDRVKAGNAKGFQEDPVTLGVRIARELFEGLGYLSSQLPAVTVLGGGGLREGDAEVAFAEEFTRRLAIEGVPTRAACAGPIAIALVRGARAGREDVPQQAFGTRGKAVELSAADRVHIVSDRLTHKVLLTESARAWLVLPGSVGTFDELFGILCQLQTRTIASRRVLLVGRAFWEPLLAAMRAQLLDGARRTIAEADLDLVTIVDDPAAAVALALEPARPPASARRGGATEASTQG